MNSMAFDTFLVGGSSGKGTSDALEQRKAIRQMCSYCDDDAKIAGYHHVSIELVSQIRAGIAAAKRKGKERTEVSHDATGANASNPFHSETRMNDMIRKGSEMLRDRVLEALAMRAA